MGQNGTEQKFGTHLSIDGETHTYRDYNFIYIYIDILEEPLKS